jgi:isoquinoline 1-oxidoreductase alpha subunit
MAFTTRINGINHCVDVDGDTPLLWVIRDVLGMTGTKFGCGRALCGACTVHMDGNPVRSCAIPIERVGDAAIITIEAIGETPAGKNVQKAWLDLEVVQCGYCQSGQIMAATALLAANPNPNDDDITNAMSGNICRCGTYLRIRDAIKAAKRRPNRYRHTYKTVERCHLSRAAGSKLRAEVSPGEHSSPQVSRLAVVCYSP